MIVTNSANVSPETNSYVGNKNPIVRSVEQTPYAISTNSMSKTSANTIASSNKNVFLQDKTDGVYGIHQNNSMMVNESSVISVMVTLKYQNQNQLNTFLADIQNPKSSLYHQYLTADEFINTYSPDKTAYDGLVTFFAQQGLTVNTYKDRVSINLQGTFSQFEKVFNTQIRDFKAGTKTFYAPVKSLSLNTIYASYISGVQGLSDQFEPSVNPLFTNSGSTQDLYGTDLQVPYQLNLLYQKGYPTGLTIVTILWSGQDSSGNNVGPYYPSDINNYFSQVLPSSEPLPHVYADPIGGAPAPGISSTQDATGANYESTLDLEMAGSTAPGSNIVEVYGPQASLTYLDQCFAEVLNPSPSAPSVLQNAVVISNSWGISSDYYDSAWVSYEQQAAARGITVLASSGDNGNSYGQTAPSFPSSSAYNSYGAISVGGTTTTLFGTPSVTGTGTNGINSQSVWYNTPSAGDGSQGGVSSIYAEPSWQSGSSDANGVITAVRSGRGTPDISGVGANMEVYITSSGGSGGMTTLWGTSVASPLVAGEVAVMDNYMSSLEGFFAPTIYQFGQNQYDNKYPVNKPFNDVISGSNGAYNALTGYDLATGWGSINAYNFVEYQIADNMVPVSETFVGWTTGGSGTGISTAVTGDNYYATHSWTRSYDSGDYYSVHYQAPSSMSSYDYIYQAQITFVWYAYGSEEVSVDLNTGSGYFNIINQVSPSNGVIAWTTSTFTISNLEWSKTMADNLQLKLYVSYPTGNTVNVDSIKIKVFVHPGYQIAPVSETFNGWTTGGSGTGVSTAVTGDNYYALHSWTRSYDTGDYYIATFSSPSIMTSSDTVYQADLRFVWYAYGSEELSVDLNTGSGFSTIISQVSPSNGVVGWTTTTFSLTNLAWTKAMVNNLQIKLYVSYASGNTVLVDSIHFGLYFSSQNQATPVSETFNGWTTAGSGTGISTAVSGDNYFATHSWTRSFDTGDYYLAHYQSPSTFTSNYYVYKVVLTFSWYAYGAEKVSVDLNTGSGYYTVINQVSPSNGVIAWTTSSFTLTNQAWTKTMVDNLLLKLYVSYATGNTVNVDYIGVTLYYKST